MVHYQARELRNENEPDGSWTALLDDENQWIEGETEADVREQLKEILECSPPYLKKRIVIARIETTYIKP